MGAAAAAKCEACGAQNAVQAETITHTSRSDTKPTVETNSTADPGELEEKPLHITYKRSDSKIRRSLLLKRKLNTDPEILRGVSLQSTLRKFGLFWRASPLDLSVDERNKQWQNSEVVEKIDVFFSHTWRTKGRWKFLSLSLQLGSVHMVIYWLLAVLVVECLFIFGLLPSTGRPWEVSTDSVHCYVPSSFWGVLITPLFSSLAFLAAPYIHRSREICFLDAVCINQADQDLMERGVYGLGGFLKNSKKMQVLWSPPYLTRLWCVFELAAYRMANPDGKINVKPLFVEMTVALLWAGAWATEYIWAFLKAATASPSLLLAFPVLIPFLGVLHFLRRNLRLKQMLFAEMANFDLRKVECRSDFDKNFVHEAITEWYGGAEAFQEYVRGPLREHLLSRNLDRVEFPYIYSLLLATTAATIGFDSLAGFLRVLVLQPDACHATGNGYSPQSAVLELAISYFIGAVLGIFVCWLTVVIRFAIFLCDRYAHARGGGILDVLQTCLLFVVWGVVAACGFACSAFAFRAGILSASLWLACAATLAWLSHGGFDWLSHLLPQVLTRIMSKEELQNQVVCDEAPPRGFSSPSSR